MGRTGLAVAGQLTLDSTPRRSTHVTCVELEGEAVLYAGVQGTVHKLDPLGTALWNCLDGTVTLRELVDDLRDAFEGDSERIAADVLEYARALRRQGLIEDEPAPPP